MSKVKKAPAKKSAKSASKAKASKTKTTKKASKKSTKAKASKATKVSKTVKATQSAEELELLNETGRRKHVEKPVVERRKRRRQIDPTTCEREYSDPEIEFMQAMDDYKCQSGRMFPTCSEILEVITRMGYRKIDEAAELMYDPNEKNEDEATKEETLDSCDDDLEDEDDC